MTPSTLRVDQTLIMSNRPKIIHNRPAFPDLCNSIIKSILLLNLKIYFEKTHTNNTLTLPQDSQLFSDLNSNQRQSSKACRTNNQFARVKQVCLAYIYSSAPRDIFKGICHTDILGMSITAKDTSNQNT